jgi:hypothetical protein
MRKVLGERLYGDRVNITALATAILLAALGTVLMGIFPSSSMLLAKGAFPSPGQGSHTVLHLSGSSKDTLVAVKSVMTTPAVSQP